MLISDVVILYMLMRIMTESHLQSTESLSVTTGIHGHLIHIQAECSEKYKFVR